MLFLHIIKYLSVFLYILIIKFYLLCYFCEFLRQNDIRTKFILHDIRLAMPMAYLGGKKTDFFTRCARSVLSLTDNILLTEYTDNTEFFRQKLKDRWLTLRVPSGFELSPTDCTDHSDFKSSFSSFDYSLARDFVRTRHNPNKFGFCSRLLQNSLVLDCV